MTTSFDRLVESSRDCALLTATSAILGWDQETMMPERGIALRSQQLAQLARLHHEQFTSKAVGEMIGEAASTLAPDSAQGALVRELRRDYDRDTRLPAALVEELARVSSTAQHEWAEARKASDFARFRPWLEQLVRLNREKASCYGIPEGGEAWDALADGYEPGCRAAGVERVFRPLRSELTAFIDRVVASPKRPNNRFNETALPIAKQEAFVRFVAEAIGFDFSRGRLDRSTHPFCGGSHCNDVRLTTRFLETCLNDALGSTMHEAGHGMYEQGLPAAWVGTPLGQAVSLGIHESQSRLWENQVGRGRAFWSWAAPHLPKYFGAAVSGFSHDELYGAANTVERGLIRVESDEATYNLHIMVRFEIERALIGGQMEVADLPATWNRLYREIVGVEVPDDRRGCLQDVHWSMGAFGYFPTYTLGTLYAAQFFDAATAAIPGLQDGFARGEFQPLLGWLNQNIHAHGRRFLPGELCQRVTGAPLSSEPFLNYLKGKIGPLYGL